MKLGLTLMVALAAIFAFGVIGNDALAQGRVTGQVIDAEENGVGGVTVFLHGVMQQRGQRPFRAETVSQRDGSFGFGDVPAGRYIIGAMDRNLGGVRMPIEVGNQGLQGVVLQLQGRGGNNGGGERPDPEDVPTADATVTVVDADGVPVAEAIVVATWARPMERGQRPRIRPIRGVTDENGVVTFESIPVGNYLVHAGIPGQARGRGMMEVTEDGGEVEITLVFRQEREGGDNEGGGRR